MSSALEEGVCGLLLTIKLRVVHRLNIDAYEGLCSRGSEEYPRARGKLELQAVYGNLTGDLHTSENIWGATLSSSILRLTSSLSGRLNWRYWLNPYLAAIRSHTSRSEPPILPIASHRRAPLMMPSFSGTDQPKPRPPLSSAPKTAPLISSFAMYLKPTGVSTTWMP